MFSEVQRNFIQQFVLANKNKTPYYIAYTNTNINNTGGGDNVSFYIILSDKPITAVNQYRYTISGSCERFSVRSGNASYNYHAERVTALNEVSEVNINNYEFVYTNAEFSGVALQPDLMITNGVEQSHFDGFSLALLVIIVSILFVKMIRKGGGGYGKL